MLKITAIPAFETNYFWVLRPDRRAAGVLVVDPGDCRPVLSYLHRHSLTLTAILITHRHHDHTGGIDGLLEHYPVAVYGPRTDLIPQVTDPLEDGDRLQVGGLIFQVIAVPGHTWEHIAYYLPNQDSLFCGDALFAAGCGRRFDGTAEIMWHSLNRLAALPDQTRIYCAHEYTLANLQFAVEVEPGNADIAARLRQVQELRRNGHITLPSVLEEEKRTNPFLRCAQPAVRRFVKARSPFVPDAEASIFGTLRELKDSWSPPSVV